MGQRGVLFPVSKREISVRKVNEELLNKYLCFRNDYNEGESFVCARLKHSSKIRLNRQDTHHGQLWESKSTE